MPEQLLSPEDLARLVGVPLKSVYRWNAHRTGPKALKVGRYVRYRPADVEAWLESRAASDVA